MRRLRWLLSVWVLGWLGSCGGGPSVSLAVGPLGDEVCLPARKVCLNVPAGALDRTLLLRIAPSTEGPVAAIGETWEVSAEGHTSLAFLKPVKVTFSLEALPLAGVERDTLLRIYTRRAPADWEPLSVPTIDRTRGELSGETDHLSPFVVLRADRLPDGGFPVGQDSGTQHDSGVVIIPTPPDSGRPDSGRPDSGPPDSGPPDSGPPDSGPPDSGRPDSGPPDSGPPDAGPPDSGPPDSGRPDSGADAGFDAGSDGGADAGGGDAGADAGFDGGLDSGVDGGSGDASVDAGFDGGDSDAGADGGLGGDS